MWNHYFHDVMFFFLCIWPPHSEQDDSVDMCMIFCTLDRSSSSPRMILMISMTFLVVVQLINKFLTEVQCNFYTRIIVSSEWLCYVNILWEIWWIVGIWRSCQNNISIGVIIFWYWVWYILILDLLGCMLWVVYEMMMNDNQPIELGGVCAEKLLVSQ